ncbi:MAG: ABC transporter ATP-binding protein [Candidatus Hodarchaeales archaeon]|jgi:putative ABC transport system ATP-binding protein
MIEISNLVKEYRMGEISVSALKNITLTFFAKEFTVVLGPSGSGKTTLLNMIGGIDTPSSGEIIIEGKNISDLGRKKLTDYRRQKTGFIFQFYNLLPSLTAVENVEIAVELVGVKTGNGRSFNKYDVRDRALELLDKVFMKDRSNHFPHQLSGGEQQRVAIARALAKDPKVLVCDEPTGNLDYEAALNILEIMRRIADEEGKVIILVTHNQVIGKIADRVIRLRSGEVVEDRVNEKKLDIRELLW